LLLELDIRLVCITAGSGYYNPHLMRPAIVPPHGGYRPPEDPLVAVARLLRVTTELKRQRPDFAYITSGLTYLKQWLPNVAQCLVRTGAADFAGIGRMSLSYPEMVDDVLSGRPLIRQLLCLTCSDCTTAPRNGMVSGCFGRDDFYQSRPEYLQLQKLKRS
jgi:2,4-dienoyl-CoA reductase-like NADH-dependent reductase (Old Yellow Enzyme family)